MILQKASGAYAHLIPVRCASQHLVPDNPTAQPPPAF